jgi:hypothetical protein
MRRRYREKREGIIAPRLFSTAKLPIIGITGIIAAGVAYRATPAAV